MSAAPPRLAVIGDVHASFARLGRVLDRVATVGVQGVLLVGDLGSNDVGFARDRTPVGDASYRNSVAEVLDRVRRLGVPVAWVPGNHDLPDIGRGADAAEGSPLRGNVDGRVASIAGLKVTGIGGAGPDRFGFCYEWADEDIRRRPVPEADVLLCHCPPRHTPLDAIARGVHVGSQAIRELAERWRGVLVCGHIHEAGGVFRLGDCLCLNAGGLGRPYGADRVGFIEGTDAVIFEDLAAGARVELRR